MNVLIIGYGSIGKRHVRILNKLDLISGISVVSQLYDNIEDIKFYKNIDEVEDINQYDYFIIANETYKHSVSLKYLDKKVQNKIFLVEKPIFEKKFNFEIENNKVFVAYNLRFHPILQFLKNRIKDKVLYVNVFFGQYLPTWRPDTDYKKCYSASKISGGGILRDISHEIDYIHWLFGKMTNIKSFCGKISNLEIDSDDISISIAKTEKGTFVNLSLDSISRIPIRNMIIHTNEVTINADFVKSEIKINEEIINFEKDRDISYLNMHKALLKNDLNDFCTFKEAIEVLEVIEKIEKENS